MFVRRALVPLCLLAQFSACDVLPRRVGGVFLGPPGTEETQIAVDLYIEETPIPVNEDIWRIKSTATLTTTRNVQEEPVVTWLPEHGALKDEPLSITRGGKPDYAIVAYDKRGTVRFDVEGLSKDGRVIARGSATAALEGNAAVSVNVGLLRGCDIQPDCEDGTFCQREECVNGICEQSLQCPRPADSCVDVTCNEMLRDCLRHSVHEVCQALDPATYCDQVDGKCREGDPCESDNDCPVGDPCQPQVCDPSTKGCTPGPRVDTDDHNACTQDACDSTRGPVHISFVPGNVCFSTDLTADGGVPGGDGGIRTICRYPTDADHNILDGGTLQCLQSECGDHVPDFTFFGGTEDCDDGNQIDDDTCTGKCQFPRCGDGLPQPNTLREQCDDGNTATDDMCIQCRNATCGDGYVNRRGGEECDDGEEGLLNDADGCDHLCQSTAFTPHLLLGCPAGIDAGPGCVPLNGVEDLSLQTYLDGGAMVFSDDYLISDRSGFKWGSLRDPQLVKRQIPRGTGTSIPTCEEVPGNPRLVVVPDSQGAPDTMGGVEGLTFFSNEIVYKSAATQDIYQLKLDQWGPDLHEAQFWAYVAGEYGVVECCPADFQFTWRGNRCTPCRDVVPERIPQGLEPRAKFNFLEAVYTVSSDPVDRAIHIISDDNSNCPGQEPNVKLTVCGAPPPGPDGGVRHNADGGIIRAQASWRYIGVSPPECVEQQSAAMLVSEPANHRVVRVGINIPLDLLGKCMSAYRIIAGVGGVPGNDDAGMAGAQTHINTPTGVGQDALCNIFFADTGNNLVRQVTPDGKTRIVANIPGIKSLAVHPNNGIVVYTNDAVWLLVND